MKLPTLAMSGLVILGLFGGAYLLGRRDAPGKVDAITHSLLDGIKAYKARVDSLEKEKKALTTFRDLALRRARVAESEADSIHRLRVPLPSEVPTGCQGWADNLNRCDEEQAKLKSSLLDTRLALERTAKLQLLAEQRATGDSARADSAMKVAKRKDAQDKVLGVKLPSRTTSLGIGLIGGWVISMLTRSH